MTRIEVYESSDAFRLAETLNGLPAETKVISIYARGSSHWAWVQVSIPEPVSVPEVSRKSEFENANKKNNSNKKGK